MSDQVTYDLPKVLYFVYTVLTLRAQVPAFGIHSKFNRGEGIYGTFTVPAPPFLVQVRYGSQS